ncbi:MAG: hypothetical protein J5651_01290 [Salinivirgaceae bacterium]|nr:hypothetical protein [Salinivirgaceae bacterium]
MSLNNLPFARQIAEQDKCIKVGSKRKIKFNGAVSKWSLIEKRYELHFEKLPDTYRRNLRILR